MPRMGNRMNTYDRQMRCTGAGRSTGIKRKIEDKGGSMVRELKLRATDGSHGNLLQ